MNTLKSLLKKLIPETLQRAARPWYHGLLALMAHYYYGQPSNSLTVIGVTGTAGKSTTVAMLAHILNKSGHKAGSTSTVDFFDGTTHYVNKHGLSMPNEFLLQKNLVAMKKNGCAHAIIEATSEGLAQNRQAGVNFDVALFTNLAPAHLDAHGGYENYRAAKGRLFDRLHEGQKKSFFPHKIIGVNLDDAESNFFSQFAADKKFGVSFSPSASSAVDTTYVAELVSEAPAIAFTIRTTNFTLPLFGKFNAYNALLAVAAAAELGIDLEQSSQALRSFSEIDGRMESIPNQRDITIFVDYAPEPHDMQSALEALQEIPHNRIIHVFGTTGGHRDKRKRFEFGSISAGLADTIILTNDDVYDSNPDEIIADMQQGVNNVPTEKRKAKEVVIIPDRRTAIHHALHMAQPKDIVIITGKGNEQFLSLPGNQRIEWDERATVREELNKLT